MKKSDSYWIRANKHIAMRTIITKIIIIFTLFSPLIKFFLLISERKGEGERDRNINDKFKL